MTCPASYLVTQADVDNGSFTNTATADSTETGPDTETETVTFTQTPALSIAKTATPGTYDSVGDVIGYSFLVTNSGNVALSGPFAVSDDQASDESCPATASMAPGASITCTASYTITLADLNAGSVTNIASATNGTVTSPTDTETVTAVQNPALTLVKSITSGIPYDSVGDILSYSFVVTNAGNVSLAGPVTVADNRATDESCPAVTTVGNLDGNLDPGEDLTCTASYAVTPGDLNNGSVTNTASATADGTNSNTDSQTASAVSIVDPAVTKSGDPSTASIGDTIVFTLVITNNGSIDATNVRMVDVIPAFLTITNSTASPPATTDNSTGNTVDLTFATVAPTDVYTVTITTFVNSSASPPGGSNIVDLTADDDDDPSNNTDSAPITIVIGTLGVPETGFAPGRVTRLPSQPAEEAYVGYGDLWLEIPKLALHTSIVGVPQSGGGWDVSWLGEEAGYLNGTAFPTWAGNSVITGHVTLSSGLAGPFADLKSLRFGDRVIIHAWGERYVYEIRELDLVSPTDRQVFRHEERSWLTLVTCQGYDEREDAYRWRVVARAVLVEIEDLDVPGGPDERPGGNPSGTSRPAGSGGDR
jgi:LPXTG-site transpeptidase (sortase) family protein